MKKPFVIILFLITAAYVNAQQSSSKTGQNETTQTELNEEEVLLFAMQMPEFKGGRESMLKFISQNLKYPEDAKEKNIKGQVVLQFVVSRTGDIKNIVVERPLYPSLDQEAIRVVEAMPKWRPGNQNGKPVNVKISLPIQFKLDDAL